MKTAEQRAEEVLEVLGVPMHQNRVRSVVSVLKQYARDQRHLCAEAMNAWAEDYTQPSVYGAVFNTPFPGE